MEFTQDILSKINELFPDHNDRNIILEFLKEKSEMTLNVGKLQFIRSLLVLINGDIKSLNKFERITDPRDIITRANDLTDGIYNFLNEPFD